MTTFQKCCYEIVPWVCSCFSEGHEIFLYPAFSVPTGHSHRASRHTPRNSLKKIKMCDFDASTQTFVAKTGIVCKN